MSKSDEEFHRNLYYGIQRQNEQQAAQRIVDAMKRPELEREIRCLQVESRRLSEALDKERQTNKDLSAKLNAEGLS